MVKRVNNSNSSYNSKFWQYDSKWNRHLSKQETSHCTGK